VVSEQPYEASAVDIRSQVVNMRDSGAEVAVFYTTPAATGQAIKAADRLGWKPQYLVTYVNSDDILFQFVPASILEGMMTFNILKLAVWTDDPAVAEHHEIMKKYGGPTPSNFSIYAQALGELMVETLSRACDNLTRQGLMDAIESIDGWHSDLLLDGINVTISDTDHTAFDTGRLLKVVVENGKGRFEYFGPAYQFQQ